MTDTIKTYLGDPCKHGHHDGRYISSHGCITCAKLRKQAMRKDPLWGTRDKKEYQRRYRAENAEKIRAKKLLDNKSEKGRARQERYKAKHRERLQEQAREYAQKYYAEHKEQYRQWRQENRDKINFWALKRWAAKLNRTPKWLTDEDWNAIESLYLEAAKRSDTEGIRYEVDHIIPLQGELVSGLHVPNNLRVISKRDNASKGNRYRIE